MPSSVSGTSAGPNSNSDSTTPIDPASSPGSPITPVEDSPMAPSVSQLDTGENEGEGDDSLTTKVKMEYAPKKSGTDRPRSLRIDSLGPLGSHPNPSMEALLLSQATGGRFDRNPFGLGGGSSAGVFLSNASLHPNVQTATSGSGTFRLVTPRLTTPDAVERSGSNEAEAASPARHAHKIGHGGSYFANAAIPSSGAWADANGANGANGNGTPGAQNGYSYNYGFNQNQGPQRTGARERPRKKPLSAAARLSTFYGNALAATSSSSSTGGNAGANAGGNAGAGAGGTKK